MKPSEVIEAAKEKSTIIPADAQPSMKTSEVIEAAKRHLEELTQLKLHNVTGMKKENDEWKVTVELVEKKSIPDAMDIFGIYEIVLDGTGGLVNFERKGMRRRGDVN